MVKSLLVTIPAYLDAAILPAMVKQQYLAQYRALLAQLDTVQIPVDYNVSDPHNHALIVKEQAQMCVNILSAPEPNHSNELRQQLVDHCRKWDQVYQYNARELYPELMDIWDRYGY
jgi:hypothetical protein